MGRKRRRRARRNLIRQIFVLIRRFLRHLQEPSISPRKRRKRRKKHYSLISPIFALGTKLLSNHQKSVAIPQDKPIKTDPVDKNVKIAKLEIESHSSDAKIIRIQK